MKKLDFRLIIKTLIKIFLMTFVWLLVSEIAGDIILSINHRSENWFTMVCELMLEIVAIGLMYLAYEKHPQIWAFPKENWHHQYFQGFGLGIFWFALAWLTCVLLGGFKVQWIFKFNNLGWLILFLVGFMIQSMFEELLCRGYVMGKLLELHLPKTALIFNSLLFMFMHIGNDGFSWLAVLDLLFFALTMSLIRLQTQNLWFVGAFHAAWNFAEGVLFGTSVSGTPKQAIVFNSITVPHKYLSNGGIFGVEGSLVSVIFDGILLLIVGYIFYHRQVQKF